ncbi:MAG: DUF4097 family beta strand repeat protein [Armatimonadota bacterium]|nr:MAG: DUF4097 family beta strand repeat protein [Armatimonadota bacterium]
MRARYVFLALLIIIVGMAITASRKGVFADWSQSIADLADTIVNLGDSWPDGNRWQEVERFTREVPTQGATSLAIVNPNGKVTVEGVTRQGRETLSGDAAARVEGQDDDEASPSVVIEVIRYGRGDTTAEAVDNARDARLETSENEEALNVEVTGPEHFARRARLDLRIAAPPALVVGIAVASGDVRVHGMAGSVGVAAASGDIDISGGGRVRATGASGDVSIVSANRAEVNTASGDVELRDIRGPVQCRIISGDLTLANVSGDVRISTVSGDIRARQVRGAFSATTISGSSELSDYAGSDISLKTTSGDLETAFSQPLSGNFTARSISGDIAVAIPTGSDCTVELASTSGDIRLQVPMRTVSQSRRRVTGVIGDGRGRLELSSVSGSLKVTEVESAPPATAIEKPAGGAPPARDSQREAVEEPERPAVPGASAEPRRPSTSSAPTARLDWDLAPRSGRPDELLDKSLDLLDRLTSLRLPGH